MIEKSFNEWDSEGKRLFGNDRTKWKFVCPSCGNVQSVKDFSRLIESARARPESAVQECYHRFFFYSKRCSWTAYGPKRGPIILRKNNEFIPVFDFYRGI